MSHHDASPEHTAHSHYNVHGIHTVKGDPALYTKHDANHEKVVSASRIEHIDDTHPHHPARLIVHHSDGSHGIVEGAIFDPTGEKPGSWRHLPPI